MFVMCVVTNKYYYIAVAKKFFSILNIRKKIDL